MINSTTDSAKKTWYREYKKQFKGTKELLQWFINDYVEGELQDIANSLNIWLEVKLNKRLISFKLDPEINWMQVTVWNNDYLSSKLEKLTVYRTPKNND